RLSRSTPALLTSTTGGPSSAATFATAASTWSAWLTSAPAASARPPAEVIASTVPEQSFSFRASTATANPSAARRRDVAAPMPRAPPVTMATRCASSGMYSSWATVGLRFPAGGICPRLAVRLELAPGERALVHFVRAVGEPERAGTGPQVGQREVLADAPGAMGLDRLVNHPFGHRRGDDLDGLDLAVRALVADRGPAADPLAHHRQGALGRADLAHAVVNPAGAEPGLRDHEAVALPRDQ